MANHAHNTNPFACGCLEFVADSSAANSCSFVNPLEVVIHPSSDVRTTHQLCAYSLRKDWSAAYAVASDTGKHVTDDVRGVIMMWWQNRCSDEKFDGVSVKVDCDEVGVAKAKTMFGFLSEIEHQGMGNLRFIHVQYGKVQMTKKGTDDSATATTTTATAAAAMKVQP